MLSIDLTESAGVISATATEADAQAGRTLVLVDDELMAYGAVVPTGDYTADLTYLERGLYGTAPAMHAIGAPFARIDQTKVFRYGLPAQYVGSPLYFQFPTANKFGNSAQSLADCITYEFVPSVLPTPQGFSTTYVYAGGSFTGIRCSWGNAAGSVPQSFTVRWSASPSGTMGQVYGTAEIPTAGATSFLISAADLTGSGDGFAYVSLQANSGSASSAWTPDASLPAPTITSVTTLTDTGGHFEGVRVLWTAPAGATPTGYNLLFSASNLGPDGTTGAFGAVYVPGAALSYVIPAATFQSVSGLAVLAGYNVALQPLYGSASGEWTTETTVAVQPLLIPSGKLIVTATGTAGELDISWAAWTGLSGQTGSDGALIPENWVIYAETGGVVTHETPVAAPFTGAVYGGFTSGATYKISAVSYGSPVAPQNTAEMFDGAGFPTISAQATAVPA